MEVDAMANSWKWLAIIALVALVAVGGGLGVSLGLTSADLSNTRTTLATTQANLATTQANLVSTQNTLTSTQSELSDTKTQLTSTKSQLASTQSQLTSTKSQLASTESELETTQATLTSTENELTSTKSQLTSTQTQLAALQAVYPLKNFPDLNSLREWLATQTITTFTFANTLALQEAAADDGWLISASISWDSGQQRWEASNTAILSNGDVYMFYCDDHTLSYSENIYD
jgi:multidrug efflux pump subunit AcrA (membrane-fusion protein)